MFARTERLLLRPGWAEDAPALHRAWNDDVIARALLGLPVGGSLAEVERFLTREREMLSPYFLLFARTGGAPRLVGGCGITPDAQGRRELSFWIARPFWGLGFATEAADAVARMARASGIGTLIARPTAGNIAAAHVLGKIGFRPSGRTEKRHSSARGGAVACALYEDSGLVPMPGDSSQELYMDRAPIAA